MFNSFPQPKPDSGGSFIKSIQSGQISMDTATKTVPITTVNPKKSIVLVTISSSSAAAGASNAFVRASNLTAITFDLIIPTATAATTAYWQVIEFANVKSLQTGDIVISPGGTPTTSVPISVVNTAKAFVVVSFVYKDGNNGFAREMGVGSALLNSTTLNIIRGGTQWYEVSWQVVELL